METPEEEDGADGDRDSRRRKESISYDDDSDDDETSGMDEAQSQRGAGSTPTSHPEPTADSETSVVVQSSKGGANSGVKVDERTSTISLAPLRVDPSARPLLMVDLIEKAAASVLVRSRNSIDQAYINEEEEGRGRCLQTAGINFEEIYQLDDGVVDHDRLLSNDIWKIRCAYGVEAARNSIVQQIRGVFGAYGIEVDPRHLSLIADYMTFDGGYKAMNRIGMEESSSSLLQMSFETTVHFLKQAAIINDSD